MKQSKITDKMISLMSEEDQAKYSGKIIFEKPASRRILSLERHEHRIFQNWLRLHNYFCVRHSRTDKRTTDQVGAPDFSVYDKYRPLEARSPIARCLLIEFKQPGNKMDIDQELWASHCRSVVHIANSAEMAITLVLEYFGP